MPTYEYECLICGKVIEEFHGINETPIITCKCKGKCERQISAGSGFIMKNSNNIRRAKDKQKRHKDIKSDLSENYNVEEMTVVPNREGKGIEETYKDIKDRGSMVKDQMQKKIESENKRMDLKQKKWSEKALKRTTKRGIEKKKRRQEAEVKKNRISIG